MECYEDSADIKSVINGQTDRQTDRQGASNMAPQLFERLRPNKEKNK